MCGYINRTNERCFKGNELRARKKRRRKKKITWEGFLDNAIIDLGLKPYEFWEMTFVDYIRYVIHKAKKDATEWEHTRGLMSYILNTQVEKKNQKKPKDIMPLWTDTLRILQKKPLRTPTKEEKEELLKKVNNGK